MRRDRVGAAAGTLLTLPLVVGSYVAAFGAFSVYDRIPRGTEIQKSLWLGYLLNGVTPLLWGVVCTSVFAAALLDVRAFLPGWRGHVGRTWLWYALAVSLQLIVLAMGDTMDFGLWGQVVTWPEASLIGGITTDAVVTAWRDHGRTSRDASRSNAE
jgi:hypothetical protein